MAIGGREGSHQHTVLIVDDSDDTRESLAMLLELEGHRVVSAASGAKALQLMVTLGVRPCVIVVDLVMPVMDGLMFRTELARHPDLAAISVVALSGHEGLRRQALASGFMAALLKPCNIEHLLSIVAQHCGTRPAIRRAQPA